MLPSASDQKLTFAGVSVSVEDATDTAAGASMLRDMECLQCCTAKKIYERRLIALPMRAQQRHLRNPAPQRMQKREDVNSSKLFNIK
jgi:hypothetical protein